MRLRARNLRAEKKDHGSFLFVIATSLFKIWSEVLSMLFLRARPVGGHYFFDPWCNGSTTDFGSVC